MDSCSGPGHGHPAGDWFGSHGYVRLEEEDGKLLYERTPIGTSVHVFRRMDRSAVALLYGHMAVEVDPGPATFARLGAVGTNKRDETGR